MKLQNLIYATMVACAFSACSNDDDPNIPDPALELDATLTVGFSAIGANNAPSTFSTPETRSNEAKSEVDKVGMAIFKETGELINYKEQSVTSSTIDSTACIAVKSGNVKVLVVVNPSTDAFAGLDNIGDFKTAVANNVELNSAKPIMASAVVDVAVAKGRNVLASEGSIGSFPNVDNPITAKGNIKVFRNIANIQLKSIKVTAREDFKNATLKVKKVYVMNYRNGVMYFGAATPWCPVVNSAAAIVSNNGGSSSTDKYTAVFPSSVDVADGGSTESNALKLANFFVYDNSSATRLTSNVTTLVIQGDFIYTAGNGATITETNKTWPVPLNNVLPQAGTNNADYKNLTSHCGVLRNVQYIVNATITGPGSDDPETPSDAASLTANIDVVQWGTVELNENID